LESIQRLVRTSPQLSDSACLRIINPPAQEKFRDHLLPKTGVNGRNPYWLPTLEPWRVSHDVGVMLDNHSQIVRANYFRVNPKMLPKRISHYYVSIFRYDREGTIGAEDFSKSNEKHTNTAIMKTFLLAQLPEWKNAGLGFAYDGKSSLYTSASLSFKKGGADDHFQADVNFPPNSHTTYSVLLCLAGEVVPPTSQKQWSKTQDLSVLQALDIALLSFARWEVGESNPSWIIAGSKAFRSDGTTYNLSATYIARLGYHASLKCCASGLAMVSDISVSCFLQGGSLLDLMAAIGGFRSIDDMARSCDPRHGLPSAVIKKLEEVSDEELQNQVYSLRTY
jgi:hypothetical protein